MKKFISVFFIFFIVTLNLFTPISVLADDPTMEILLKTENEHGTTGKWAWGFEINTTGIPNGATASISLYENETNLYGPIQNKQINNNSLMYLTGFVLNPDTNYSIVVQTVNPVMIKSYSKKTPLGTVVYDPIMEGDPNTAIGAPTPPIAPPTQVYDVDPLNKKGELGVYRLLAPIGEFEFAPDDIGGYFNTILSIAIGLCAVLAVIMIVIGGVQYMGDESIFGKTQAKDRIGKAILGLLIALGSYALLNTINPDFLNSNINIKQVSVEIVDLPDAGDGAIDPDFKTGKGSYATTTPVSAGVAEAVIKLKEGWQIDAFLVSSKNNGADLKINEMTIFLKKGTEIIDYPVNILPGTEGYSEIGNGVQGDKKTPKGNWKILQIRTSEEGKPVYSGAGSNMGASFWLLSPTTNGERGIGVHGNKNGTLAKTYGCIRLTNSDLLALLPYIKTGIPFVIN
jgi:lipoprotein-anchoring transpeptidase ErfK/SrfK